MEKSIHISMREKAEVFSEEVKEERKTNQRPVLGRKPGEFGTETARVRGVLRRAPARL